MTDRVSHRRSRPVLLAVAHGSRDPAAQETARGIARRVSVLAQRGGPPAGPAGVIPGLDVRTAFVQNARPSLAEALDRALRDTGQDGGAGAGAGVVIVPLLLSVGYHLTSDIAAAAARAGVPVAAPLGPDPRLVPALADRLRWARVPAGTPVVLAAAGSASLRAIEDARSQAALLAGHLRAPVLAAFAAGAQPAVDEAVAALAAQADGPVAVASYLLAPGRLHDRLRASRATWVSAPLGDHPAVADLVLDRFRTARGAAMVPPGQPRPG
jgi:sirohydrochlorin ferrochelatase